MNETTLFEAKDLRARGLGRVALLAWHEAPRKATIDALAPKVVQHHAEHPEGVALVVAARGGPPDDEARKAFREMVRSVERSVLGVAVLVPVAGLRGKVVRGAVTAGILALRLPFTVKVLETPELVANHVAALLRDRRLDSPSAEQIERTLRDIQTPSSPH